MTIKEDFFIRPKFWNPEGQSIYLHIESDSDLWLRFRSFFVSIFNMIGSVR